MTTESADRKPVENVELPAGPGDPGEPQRLVLDDHWVFMIDPAWAPGSDDAQPPVEAVVGGWYIGQDGETGMFQPNPDYQPSEPGLPTDPVDAAVQLMVRGDGDGDELLKTLHQVVLGVALDEEGNPVVAPAPDGVPSVLVTTAPAHREQVNAPDWAEVTLRELAEALPDEGIDVLLNPGAPASIRLLATVVKQPARGPVEQTTSAQ
ncbi:type VII secretion system-associated protein [Kibdelosporangium phytohabitans]|uniref:Type VII secretion system-associated protein n=1 Tax=Kibdelosporangium phytohabitans TaxID=860235 RepID=A0A0N9HY38_9PSEU|nr:type VII secretion system-associated protein [Kibdelosporangium phytohabitans]ALG10353.1 hypothetical protein AOZ06_28750 [Kibdelosporangium phytohabitans]MBE1461399.1 hypothetical protein [Kibdelosporangium phytohabitans]